MTVSAIPLARWRWYPLLHALLFQLGWFVCVDGAAHGDLLRGPLAVALVALVHLLAMRFPADELRLMGGAMMIGVLGDSLLGAGGAVIAAPFDDRVAPFWLLSLWALFASTLHTCCRWLLRWVLLGCCCGAIAGPCCYLAAEHLGALRFPAGTTRALCAVALEWSLAMPMLILWTRRIDDLRLKARLRAADA